jgi:CDP-glucose 4,6-dehydratase
MSILVTGASGAFGAHFAAKKLAEGQEVISIRHDERPWTTARLLGIDEKITWVRGDILNQNLCRRVVADYCVDAIYHFAALPIVQVGMRTTVPLFETNLMGTINLLEAVKENTWAGKLIHFVYISTDKVYGDVGAEAYTEDMPLNGLGIYECSKAGADLAVRTFAKCGFIPKVTVVRPSNIVAPGDINLGRVFARTIIPCLRGDRPRLYRTAYLREFTHVEDAVTAIEAAATVGGVFNAGSGEQRSLEQCVDAILKFFPGIAPEWTEPPKLARVEIPFQELDTTKLRTVTGWVPRYTFTETVARTVEWWSSAWPKLPQWIKEWQAADWHS